MTDFEFSKYLISIGYKKVVSKVNFDNDYFYFEKLFKIDLLEVSKIIVYKDIYGNYSLRVVMFNIYIGTARFSLNSFSTENFNLSVNDVISKLKSKIANDIELIKF